jgi:hypothetical protein
MSNRRLSAKLVPILRIDVVSVTDSYDRILCSPDWSRYYFF